MLGKCIKKGMQLVVAALMLFGGCASHALASGGPGNYVWTAHTVGTTSPILVNIAGSSDNSVLFASGIENYLYVSTTSGATWTAETAAGIREWYGTAASSDGSVLAATTNPGDIFVSTTTGATWTDETTLGSKEWQGITASANGSILAAVASGGDVYVSTTTGSTWTDETGAGSRDWETITSSKDGSVLAAAVWGGDIYVSTTTGATWSHVTSIPTQDWISITASADGSHITAASYSDSSEVNTNGNVWTSTDYGKTWTQQTGLPASGWYSVASSANGSVLVAGQGAQYSSWFEPHLEGYIYTSIDGGAHWSIEGGPNKDVWDWIAISEDGSRIAAAGGSVWTGVEAVGATDIASAPPAPPTLLISTVNNATTHIGLSTVQSDALSVIGYAFVAPGIATTTQSFAIGGSTISLSIPFNGFSCGTTYTIWGFATNSLGTTNSPMQTFTTAACSEASPGTNVSSGGSSNQPIPQNVRIPHTVQTAIYPTPQSSPVPESIATTTAHIATSTAAFLTDLHQGSKGAEAILLQDFLIRVASGPAAAALAESGASGYFGVLTKAALIEFQKAVGITPASGYFGSMTRTYIANHY